MKFPESDCSRLACRLPSCQTIVAAASRAWRIALPHYPGHRERLRRRLHAASGDTVTGYELLDLVLFGAQFG
jgi:hypothetical protein